MKNSEQKSTEVLAKLDEIHENIIKIQRDTGKIKSSFYWFKVVFPMTFAAIIVLLTMLVRIIL